MGTKTDKLPATNFHLPNLSINQVLTARASKSMTRMILSPRSLIKAANPLPPANVSQRTQRRPKVAQPSSAAKAGKYRQPLLLQKIPEQLTTGSTLNPSRSRPRIRTRMNQRLQSRLNLKRRPKGRLGQRQTPEWLYRGK